MIDSPILSCLQVADRNLEILSYERPSAQGTILLIHEALGSVSSWKDFPEVLASATGYNIIAYSRAGHGNSEGPVEPRSLDYYQKQVDAIVPAILNHFAVVEPVLYGHSEGAGIALLYAAAKKPVRAILAECPIIVPEERTTNTIRQLEAGYASSDLGGRLGKYHVNPDEVFYSWIQSNKASFSKEFPFEQYLKRIECPLLVLQGSHDEFGGILQYQTIHRSLPLAQHAVFDAGHLLHRERPDLVVSTVSAFLQTLPKANMVMDHAIQSHSRQE